MHKSAPLNSFKSSPSLSSLPPQSNSSLKSIPKSSLSNITSTESLVQNQSQEHATNNETPDYEKGGYLMTPSSPLFSECVDSVQPMSSIFSTEAI